MATTAPVKTYLLWRNEWLKVILQKNQYDQKKKKDVRLLLLSSNKATHYCIKLTTPGAVLKKYILFFKKFDASNRSLLTAVVPKNCSFQKEH